MERWQGLCWHVLGAALELDLIQRSAAVWTLGALLVALLSGSSVENFITDNLKIQSAEY